MESVASSCTQVSAMTSDLRYSTYYLHCTCCTQVSGYIIQTPLTDSIIGTNFAVWYQGFVLFGGRVKPTAWVDQSAMQFCYAPLI